MAKERQENTAQKVKQFSPTDTKRQEDSCSHPVMWGKRSLSSHNLYLMNSDRRDGSQRAHKKYLPWSTNSICNYIVTAFSWLQSFPTGIHPNNTLQDKVFYRCHLQLEIVAPTHGQYVRLPLTRVTGLTICLHENHLTSICYNRLWNCKFLILYIIAQICLWFQIFILNSLFYNSTKGI